MIRNALKKIPFLTSVLAGLILLIFILFQALPGPEQILSSQRSDGETTKAIVKELGLDQPIYIQAFKYLNDVSPVSVYASDAVPSRLSGLHASLGDWQLWLKFPYLRQSFQTRRLVSSMLGEAFLGTLLLAVSAMLIAVFLGVPLGIWASMRRNSWVDHFIVWISAIGISVPSFFSAMIFSWLFFRNR
jgi:peptide/nickel transport system permease protein